MDKTDCSNTISVSYDFQKRAHNFEQNSRWVTDKNINNIPFEFLLCQKKTGDILDAGGGTGYLSYYLCCRMPASSVTIVDTSINMLQAAKERIPNAIIVNKSIEAYCNTESKRFDIILARQIFHYVNDVDVVIRLLKEKLKEDGILYVGQFVVYDEATSTWNNILMQKISHNRKRSFIVTDFQDLFTQHNFKIIKLHTENYEENLKDFYNRRTDDKIPYEILLRDMIALIDNDIKEKMSVRITPDNLFFSYQFCHLFLAADQ